MISCVANGVIYSCPNRFSLKQNIIKYYFFSFFSHSKACKTSYKVKPQIKIKNRKLSISKRKLYSPFVLFNWLWCMLKIWYFLDTYAVNQEGALFALSNTRLQEKFSFFFRYAPLITMSLRMINLYLLLYTTGQSCL